MEVLTLTKTIMTPLKHQKNVVPLSSKPLMSKTAFIIAIGTDYQNYKTKSMN